MGLGSSIEDRYGPVVGGAWFRSKISFLNLITDVEGDGQLSERRTGMDVKGRFNENLTAS